MPLDLMGNISLTFSVTSLFLLILGLPFARALNTKKNLDETWLSNDRCLGRSDNSCFRHDDTDQL